MVIVLTAGVPGPGGLLAEWTAAPGPLALLALGALAYVWAARRLAGGWPATRTWSFLAGLGVLAVALLSGLDAWGERLLSVHMAQHLLLGLAVPPLLLGGRPARLALRAVGPSLRPALVRALRSRIARAAAWLPVAWSAFAAAMLGTHFSGLYDLALRSPAAHEAEHLLYLAGGLLFWWPLLEGDPGSDRALGPLGRIAYLLAAMPVMAVVGVVLTSAQRVRYPSYLGAARELGVSALSDQRAGAAVMWVGGMAIMAAALPWVAWRALAREERLAAAAESAAEPGRRRGRAAA